LGKKEKCTHANCHILTVKIARLADMMRFQDRGTQVIGTSLGLPDVEPLVWKMKAISSSCESEMLGSKIGVGSILSDARARYVGSGKLFNIDSKASAGAHERLQGWGA
jgi:hypothetical protein